MEEFVRAPSRAVDGVVVRVGVGQNHHRRPGREDRGRGRAGSVLEVAVPSRLAWAVTIHKAQGQTLDLLEVDLRGCRVRPGVRGGESRDGDEEAARAEF